MATSLETEVNPYKSPQCDCCEIDLGIPLTNINEETKPSFSEYLVPLVGLMKYCDRMADLSKRVHPPYRAAFLKASESQARGVGLIHLFETIPLIAYAVSEMIF